MTVADTSLSIYWMLSKVLDELIGLKSKHCSAALIVDQLGLSLVKVFCICPMIGQGSREIMIEAFVTTYSFTSYTQKTLVTIKNDKGNFRLTGLRCTY